MQTHSINGFSLLRQWNCSCPKTCQCTCDGESETTDVLTVVLFCGVHIDISATLNLLQCLRVNFGCRAVQWTNSAETSLTGTAGYVAIQLSECNQLKLAPSFL